MNCLLCGISSNRLDARRFDFGGTVGPVRLRIGVCPLHGARMSLEIDLGPTTRKRFGRLHAGMRELTREDLEQVKRDMESLVKC